MGDYKILLSSDEATVVAEYATEYRAAAEYQSEADLEREFINLLRGQGYEYMRINDEAHLIANLRLQLEMLNSFKFSNAEWEQFFKNSLANSNEGIEEKTNRIQDDYIQVLKREDGTTKNVYLLDKENVHNNSLQVINQYEEDDGAHKSRYDVTVLVNGLPLVHIELKRRGVAIREAFNQIKRYQRDSFWASSGLYEYVQIFVISNGTHTKYYSNTTRHAHVKELGEGGRRNSKKTSNSFEFASYWADARNRAIPDLVDFTKTFFAKHTLLRILTRYCVFTSEKMLLVMRPYQIAATERILGRVVSYSYSKKTGILDAGGYVWHTTGSGKTLTSFKTAQLVKGFEGIDKVLFVVDRLDLDYQTMKEYERFEKGAASSNKSTAVLQRQLENPNDRIIVTTIQKLDVFVGRFKSHEVYKKHVVIIFDECHRSQFGDMHKKIVKAFRNYHLFGFTGTPIFAQNAGKAGNPLFRTTEQAFGEKLHTYTIVDAIGDGNVLPFRVETINTFRRKDGIIDKQVPAIDAERAIRDPQRISLVVSYIIEHFDQKTKRSQHYSHKGKRLAGFNSIFAVDSIPMAKQYYEEFKKQLQERNSELKVATIFSYSANEDDPEDALPEESFENEKLDKSSRDFLESAIGDYNAMFGQSFDTSSDRFQNYYKDVSQRVKDREIDLLIVVNMFLTGFDATTLNTLWVDKNLKMHGLLQAFSRTNRILNTVKTFGNIVCFRDLTKATDDAIGLFGDKDAGGIVLIKTYEEYYYGYDKNGRHERGFEELIGTLRSRYPIGQLPSSEEARKDFIHLYGAILRLKNILSAFDEFAGNEILSERDFQDYQSMYIDLYQELRPKTKGDKENINDDIVFELELIHQIEVNIDYILMLVEKYHADNCKDKTVLVAIKSAIDSSIELRSKRELIEQFIERVNATTLNKGDWELFVQERKEEDLAALIAAERLKEEDARRFIDMAFRDGALKTMGTDLDKILPPMSRFSESGYDRAKVKQAIIDRLAEFFEKYAGLV
ncbi:MAG: type I restriction endonuclease subunit R [Holophagales bacterium]|nr:type I restriction endonuclease subunit R [Holophagales bacterium]